MASIIQNERSYIDSLLIYTNYRPQVTFLSYVCFRQLHTKVSLEKQKQCTAVVLHYLSWNTAIYVIVLQWRLQNFDNQIRMYLEPRQINNNSIQSKYVLVLD